MTAAVIDEFGGSGNFRIVDIPDPIPGNDEVLIRVKAININPEDVKIRQGWGLAYTLGAGRPIVLGWDVSGTVVSRGNVVSRFEVGDDVFGMIPFPGKGGAYAEFVAAPENQFALKPSNNSHEEAASAGMAAQVAKQSLIDKVKVYEGQKLLIYGAAQGIGHFAVQIAKSLGAHVTGVADISNKAFVLGLGADQFYDYGTPVFERFDFVLDTLGGTNINRSVKMTNWGGILVYTEADPRNEIAEFIHYEGINGVSAQPEASGKDAVSIADMLSKGIIKSNVGRTFPIGQISAAHELVESASYQGTIVVNV